MKRVAAGAARGHTEWSKGQQHSKSQLEQSVCSEPSREQRGAAGALRVLEPSREQQCITSAVGTLRAHGVVQQATSTALACIPSVYRYSGAQPAVAACCILLLPSPLGRSNSSLPDRFIRGFLNPASLRPAPPPTGRAAPAVLPQQRKGRRQSWYQRCGGGSAAARVIAGCLGGLGVGRSGGGGDVPAGQASRGRLGRMEASP